MKWILKILLNRYFLYTIITACTLGMFKMQSCHNTESERLQTYNRQVQGQLSEVEKELQSANNELGVAKSKLVTQKELAEQWKKAKEEKDKKFDAFVKKHKLKIKSLDRAIAKLKQEIVDGTTTVVVSEGALCEGIEELCVISYNWEDALKRFRLNDPNIFKSGNETFESEQLFKIYGEVWTQENGSLQTRRLTLREVFQDEDGNYQPIPNAKADIVDSDFQYHNPPTIEPKKSWTDIFRLRAMATPSVTMFPDNGRIKLGLGLEFLNVYGFGMNTHTALDFEDIKKSEHRMGVSFNPTIFNKELNLAIGVSVGTPYIRMFKDYSINADLIFFLHD